ncbi:MAG: S41 family peptidase [Bacteroidales bacterium]|nr:S41 family peptidase [Bacteroidales bacterium]
MKLSNKGARIYFPIALSLAVIAGLLLGNFLGQNHSSEQTFVYSKPNKINKVTNYIQQNYVDSVSDDRMAESAIPAILKELDPHSVYIPARQLKEVNEPLKGNFDGIGIQFSMQEDTVVVISTISGGPSEMVGIQPGDRIVEVDGKVVAGKDISSNDIVDMLKGKRGTEVKVGIRRQSADEMLYFTITRDEIPLYSVDVSYMINDQTGYIKISRFAKTTHKEFMKALNKLKKNGAEKMVLDLRDNSGGYLNAATNIADEFLQDEKLIVYTRGQNSPKQEIYASSKGEAQDVEVAVLINEWSASASEILAGALQDNDRGIIVGRRSFGKGLVQEQIVLSDGSAMRLTVARYYTPTGRCIQKPYKEGRKQYYNDLNERFKHGEFFNADSIDFADSLKYTTPEGDVVYGGGGIMPDFFVPVDTTHNSPLFSKVRNQGTIYNFAFHYADANREQLEKLKGHQAIADYLEERDIYNEFLEYAYGQGVVRDIEGAERSREVINTRVKAYIARNIINNEGFYPIIHDIDRTLQRAGELLARGAVD